MHWALKVEWLRLEGPEASAFPQLVPMPVRRDSGKDGIKTHPVSSLILSIGIHTYIHVYICAHIRVYAYIHMYIYTHVYAYMHMYIYA